VYEVAVDVEEGGHAVVFDDVVVPDFVVEGTGFVGFRWFAQLGFLVGGG